MTQIHRSNVTRHTLVKTQQAKGIAARNKPRVTKHAKIPASVTQPPIKVMMSAAVIRDVSTNKMVAQTPVARKAMLPNHIQSANPK